MDPRTDMKPRTPPIPADKAERTSSKCNHIIIDESHNQQAQQAIKVQSLWRIMLKNHTHLNSLQRAHRRYVRAAQRTLHHHVIPFVLRVLLRKHHVLLPAARVEAVVARQVEAHLVYFELRQAKRTVVVQVFVALAQRDLTDLRNLLPLRRCAVLTGLALVVFERLFR